ncbi:MAG: hypothetical protein NVSMB62_29370 [Acidobacteriaceae bacterium]
MKNLGPSALKFATLSLALGVFLFGQKPVQAQSDGGEALVLHGCPDMTTFYGKSAGYTYQVCADIVFTPSGNVNATFHGSLLDPSTAPSSAVIVEGFPCGYKNQLTYDSQVVITPDGNVEGRCELHP